MVSAVAQRLLTTDAPEETTQDLAASATLITSGASLLLPAPFWSGSIINIIHGRHLGFHRGKISHSSHTHDDRFLDQQLAGQPLNVLLELCCASAEVLGACSGFGMRLATVVTHLIQIVYSCVASLVFWFQSLASRHGPLNMNLRGLCEPGLRTGCGDGLQGRQRGCWVTRVKTASPLEWGPPWSGPAQCRGAGAAKQ